MSKTIRASRLKNAQLKNGSFLARNIDPAESRELQDLYEFRHRVFSKELGWVPTSLGAGDPYDGHSVHFGAFSNAGDIVGCSRLILPKGGFMLEREFADLLDPGYNLRKETDTVEASQFAVSRELRRTREGFAVTELLCKTMCLWARRNGIRYCYMVLDANYLEFLQAFFSLRTIGPPRVYEPQIASVAAVFDLAELHPEDAETFWSVLGTTS
jgi:N-acyl-L-homoserine lactone synthetase